MIKKMLKNRKGQGFVEYALLITGVAMVGLLGVTMLGAKTNDLISSLAVAIPGSEVEDNEVLESGALVEIDTTGKNLKVDYDEILANSNGKTSRLERNLTGDDGGDGVRLDGFLNNNIGFD